MKHPADNLLRYWTVHELQTFLVAHDLVIAAGIAGGDEVRMAPRGRELLTFLGIIVQLEAEAVA